MVTIASILPTNNRTMLNEKDLIPFQSKDCTFKVMYVDTKLDQLNTVEDVKEVIPLVQAKIKEAKTAKVDGIIIHGFGDVGITKEDEHSSPPIIGLGRLAVRELAKLTKTKFTVMPAQAGHEVFVEGLLEEENLMTNYQKATQPIGLDPKAIRTDPAAIDKLYIAADAAIKQGIDTLTVACVSFFGMAPELQERLRAEHGDHINVLDPAAAAFIKMQEIVLSLNHAKSCRP